MISAEMRDGVITLVLPKAEETKPHRIKVRDAIDEEIRRLALTEPKGN
jgi:hypothetical protein